MTNSNKPRAGRVIHVHVDPALEKRINECMEYSDAENRAQAGRIAFRLWCSQIERRRQELKDAQLTAAQGSGRI